MTGVQTCALPISTTTGKVGGLLIRPAAKRLRHKLDPETYGGAYLVGLKGLAVIAHGSSSRRAIANAIALASRGVENRVVEFLAEGLPERPGRTGSTENVRDTGV